MSPRSLPADSKQNAVDSGGVGETDRRSARNRRVAEIAGVLVFFSVLLTSEWLTYAGSVVIFRFYPTAVPDGFFIMLSAPRTDGPGTYYIPASWRRYAEVKAERRVQTFLLPEPTGAIRGPKTQFYFTVLEGDTTRQVVEVKTTGLHRSWSRYEAYPDRVSPVGYGGLRWGLEEDSNVKFVLYGLVLLIAILAGLGAVAGVNRMLRLRTN